MDTYGSFLSLSCSFYSAQYTLRQSPLFQRLSVLHIYGWGIFNCVHTLMYSCWAYRLMQWPYKTLCIFFKNLKIKLPNDLAVPLLKMYLKKAERLIRKCICNPVFIAILFTIANIWKQPKCPSVHERILTWAFDSDPLFYMSVFVQILYHFNY